MKKFLTLLLVCVIISAVNVFVSAAPVSMGEIMTSQESTSCEENVSADFYGGMGTSLSPYEITDYNLFNYYAKQVNKGDAAYANAYFVLAGNVDFEGREIVPMGTESYPFKGHIDGRGYEISNIKVCDTAYSGVVGYMTDGSIKNLRVSYVDSEEGKTLNASGIIFGGVVGMVKPAKEKNIVISGCETEGNFVFNTKGCTYFSGIAGKVVAENGNVSVSGCSTDFGFDITSTNISYVAGAVGFANASSANTFEFSDCVSYGDVKLSVTGNVEANVGGFAAYINEDEGGWSGWAGEDASLFEDVVNIKNCASFGDVYGSSFYSSSYRKAFVGGFIGKLENSDNVKIVNSYRNAGSSVSGLGNVIVCTAGTSVDSATAKSEAFYKDTLGLDVANDFYFSVTEGKIYSRTTAKSNGGAVTSDILDMRLDEKAGIRFSAEIELYKKNYVSEYGYIIGVKSDLGDEELTFDCGKRFAYAAAFDAQNGIDVVYKNDEISGKATFKAVLINVPESHYSTVVVARPYVKYVSDGETICLYGAPIETSINEVADMLAGSSAYDSLNQAQKDLLETMTTK